MRFRLPIPKFISAKEAKYRLGEFLDKARFGHEHLVISKRGTPWAVILGIEDYEDLFDQLETVLEQLDPEFQKSLQRSIEEYRKGRVGTLEDIRKILRQKRSKGRELA